MGSHTVYRPPPAAIWPTWRYADYLQHDRGGRLLYRMPFDELFWRQATVHDVVHTWERATDSKHTNAPSQAPKGIEGFITALPINWTAREHNDSGMNLTILAQNDALPEVFGTPTTLVAASPTAQTTGSAA